MGSLAATATTTAKAADLRATEAEPEVILRATKGAEAQAGTLAEAEIIWRVLPEAQAARQAEAITPLLGVQAQAAVLTSYKKVPQEHEPILHGQVITPTGAKETAVKAALEALTAGTAKPLGHRETRAAETTAAAAADRARVSPTTATKEARRVEPESFGAAVVRTLATQTIYRVN